MKSPYLLCAQVLNTHGVRGVLKVDCLCDSPAVLAALPFVYTEKNGSHTPHKVVGAAPHGRFVLLTLEDIASLEAAVLLKGCPLFAARGDVPCDEHHVFTADIIGLPVVDADSGRLYGHVKDIEEAPASNLYIIKTPSGDVLLPAVPQFIKEIDTERGVFIRPIEGFFNDI